MSEIMMISEIETSGYKVLTVWWKDIKHDPKRLFHEAMLDFEIADKSFRMH